MSEAIPEPVRSWLESQTALSFVLWIAAIWATTRLIWTAFRKAIPALKNLIALSESLERLPVWMSEIDGRLDDMQPVLEQVRHEVLPNNGGSLRDDVVTVSLQVQQVAAQQEENVELFDELEDTITRRIERRDEVRTGTIELPKELE